MRNLLAMSAGDNPNFSRASRSTLPTVTGNAPDDASSDDGSTGNGVVACAVASFDAMTPARSDVLASLGCSSVVIRSMVYLIRRGKSA